MLPLAARLAGPADGAVSSGRRTWGAPSEGPGTASPSSRHRSAALAPRRGCRDGEARSSAGRHTGYRGAPPIEGLAEGGGLPVPAAGRGPARERSYRRWEGREPPAGRLPALASTSSMPSSPIPGSISPPSEVAEALGQIEAWLEAPTPVLLAEAGSYRSELLELLRSSRPRGPKVHDARIAALCLHGGVRELLSADRDFSRFPRLATRNPLL